MSTNPPSLESEHPSMHPALVFRRQIANYTSKNPNYLIDEIFENKLNINENHQQPNQIHNIEKNKNFLVKSRKIFPRIYPSTHPEERVASFCFSEQVAAAKKACATRSRLGSFEKKVSQLIDQLNDLGIGEKPFPEFPNCTPFDLLGEIVYLIDHEPKRLLECIDLQDTQKSVKSIKNLFHALMKKIHQRIDAHYQVHQAAQIQNADIAKQLLIPIEISYALFTSSGVFNRALIKRMMEEFVNPNDPLDGYMNGLKSGLQLIFQSETLQEKLQAVSFSGPKNPYSREIVRMALRLPLGEKISDVHAKRCALTALLTHLRQGHSNSCFASFFAIELQTQAPLQALDDFSNLLKHGQLNRLVDRQNRGFPFLMRWGQEDLSKTIRLDEKGQLLSSSGKNGYFWKAPGLKKALSSLGIAYPKRALQNWLKTKNIPTLGLEVSIEALIREIAEPIDKDLLERCYLEFSSLTSHPLLRVWENALAGMAEGKKGGLLRGALTKSLHYLIHKSAAKCGLKDLASRIDLVEKIERIAERRIHYLYDPNYHSASHPTLQGAFILYDAKDREAFGSWERIDTPEQFQALMSDLIGEFFNNEQISAKALNKVMAEIESEKFLIKLLKRYHRENALDLALGGSFRNLRCTPWVTLIGNDPNAVLKVYYEESSSYKIQECKPESARDLLFFLLSLLSKQPDDIKKRYSSEQNHLAPVRVSGTHAFSLLLSHPSIKPCYAPFFDIATWIDEKIYLPGKKIAKTFATERMRKETVDFICNHIIDPKQKKIFLNFMKNCPQKTSIHEFRGRIAEVICQMFPTPSHQSEQLKLVDLKLFELMPKELQQTWRSSVIHFADSNWQKEGHDIHYGIAVNPGSSELEIVGILESGEPFEFINQSHFFNPHKWEFYL